MWYSLFNFCVRTFSVFFCSILLLCLLDNFCCTYACVNISDTELDEDSDEGVAQHEQNPGVDDGFFVGNRPENGVAGGGGGGTDDHPHTNNHVPHDIPFPYAPGFNPNVVGEELEQLYVVHIQNKTKN